jgi:hypothetical protein
MFFLVAVIIAQTLNLIDWVLKQLGFFKTDFEKALKRAGYSKRYYYKNCYKDLILLKKLEAEFQRMKDSIKGYGGEAFFARQSVDFDLEAVRRNIERIENPIRYNSLESTKERLKNLHNLIV